MFIFILVSILIIFIIYRMRRFSKLHKEVGIVTHEDDHKFFLVYKKYIFSGKYVFSEKLDDRSLQGFVLQFEVKNSIRTGNHEFEYKIQSFSKEQPKFYFFVSLKKDNPFIG
jgi:hypothetical protein